MALHWPTFFTRLGSAIVFCIVMMAGLLWNIWAFLGLIVLIQFLCLRDYFRLISKVYPETKMPKWLPITIQLLCLVLLGIIAEFMRTGLNPLAPMALWLALGISPIIYLLSGKLNEQIKKVATMQAIAGMFYIAMPMQMLLLMRHKHMAFPIALILMIWMNDTMAYLVGSFIGKTPFSKISPKKTWEGTAGGAILAIAGAAIYGYYAPYYRMIDWMALSICAAVAGTAGDLLESKLKRMANVKDSGTMMPGHGGALDRFDSLLIATPFAFAYIYIFV